MKRVPSNRQVSVHFCTSVLKLDFIVPLCLFYQVQVPNTENSYLITGLTPGVTYVVQVYAVIKEVQSEPDKIEATTGVYRNIHNV